MKKVIMSMVLFMVVAMNASGVIVAQDDFSYPDGSLVGQGVAGDGWGGSWYSAFSGGSMNVTGGVVSGTPAIRVSRDLAAEIGGPADAGKTYVIDVSLNLDGGNYNGFEAHNNGTADSNRVMRITNGSIGQVFGFPNSVVLNFPDMTGLNDYEISIIFGATTADQDVAALSINGVAMGSLNIGTTFVFDRVSFAGFANAGGSTGLRAADDLVLTQVPEPITMLLLGVGSMIALRRKQ